MYSLGILIIIILIPIPIISGMIKRRVPPYVVIIQSVISASIALIILFLLARLSGSPVGPTFMNSINDMLEKSMNSPMFDEMIKSAGLENTPKDELKGVLTQIYEMAVNSIPAVVIVCTTIISYLEYLFISKAMLIRENEVIKMPKLSQFSLPKSALLGFIIIFALAFITSAVGIISKDIILINIQVIFEFIFTIQGIALIFFLSEKKRIPKFITFLGVLLILIIPMGRPMLFLTGITDLAFGIRQKVI